MADEVRSQASSEQKAVNIMLADLRECTYLLKLFRTKPQDNWYEDNSVVVQAENLHFVQCQIHHVKGIVV